MLTKIPPQSDYKQYGCVSIKYSPKLVRFLVSFSTTPPPPTKKKRPIWVCLKIWKTPRKGGIAFGFPLKTHPPKPRYQLQKIHIRGSRLLVLVRAQGPVGEPGAWMRAPSFRAPPWFLVWGNQKGTKATWQKKKHPGEGNPLNVTPLSHLARNSR